MQTAQLRPAEPRDREYVERLLAESGLPTADLDAAYSSLFVCEDATGEAPESNAPDRASTDGERVGVGGLEVDDESDGADSVGLLRSVAVEESARGEGYGTAISERLLDRARADDLDAVFLLTTTAEEFFADLGFETVEREAVPDEIRDTAEFTDLCPTSATCMKMSLGQV